MPKTQEQLKREKYVRHLNNQGIRILVDPTPARDHLLTLTDRPGGEGMTQGRIATLSGVSNSIISNIATGTRKGRPLKKVRRDTVTKILAVTYELPVHDPDLLRTGARTDPVGTERRLQALTCQGFSCDVLASLLDVHGKSAVYILLTGGVIGNSTRRSRFVFARTAADVAALYRKAADADPVDFGGDTYSIARAKGAARRKNYAPPSCWDEDTIDDPDAFPEWTGACGTPEGRTIHRREGIPMCAACKEKSGEKRVPPRLFSPTKFTEIRKQRHLTCSRVARLIGCNPDTVYRWQSGERAPRAEAWDRLARALGVPPEDLEAT